MNDLFAWAELPPVPPAIVAWRPHPLEHEQWPPNYKGVYVWRMKQLAKMRADAKFAAGAKAYYSKPGKAAEFIQDWMDTYNPRGTGALKWKPFVFFKRQVEFIECLEECIEDQESLLVEKARDVGLTWLCAGWSVARWLFGNDFAIGWGSRKQDLVA
jgi:phage terminase large subunit